MLDFYNQFKDFKAFEVAFFNENNELQKLVCTIKSIENAKIIILANNQKNKNVFANLGTDLKLHIYTDNGIYSATSKVLLVNKGLINTEYAISYPSKSKHSQRREYFRADLKIDFKMIVTLPKTGQYETIEGVTWNICGKGMSFLSSTPFLEYDTISAELYFSDRTVQTHAELVYTRQIVAEGKVQFVNAFTFTTISKRNIEFIVKKCFLHQLNLKKRV